MKTTLLLVALIALAPLCCIAKDQKATQAALEAAQARSLQQACVEFPELKDPNSALVKECLRLVEQYKTLDHQVLRDEQGPLRVARVAAANLERNSIKTLSGNTYRGATVSRVEPNGITITHADGLVKVPFEDLPEEMRTKYGYDPVKAAAFTDAEKVAAAQRSAADAARREEEQRRQALQMEQLSASQAQQQQAAPPQSSQQNLTVEQMQQVVALLKMMQELQNMQQQPQQDQLQYLELMNQLKGMTHSGQIKQRRIDRENEWNDPINKLRREVEALKQRQR